MLRVAVLASGRGSNLRAILRRMAEGRIQARIVLVLTNVPSAPVADVAQAAGIPVWARSHKDFPGRGEQRRAAFDAAMLDVLREARVDAVVLAGYMRLLGPAFIQAYGGRILNIHPSLLPAFPGLDGAGDALEYGAKFAGCTVHFVTGDMDAGPVVIQAALPLREGESRDSLMPRIHALEHRIYPQALSWFAAGRLRINGRTVSLLPPRETRETGTFAGARFASRPYSAAEAGSLGDSLAVDCLISPPLEEGF